MDAAADKQRAGIADEGDGAGRARVERQDAGLAAGGYLGHGAAGNGHVILRIYRSEHPWQVFAQDDFDRLRVPGERAGQRGRVGGDDASPLIETRFARAVQRGRVDLGGRASRAQGDRSRIGGDVGGVLDLPLGEIPVSRFGSEAEAANRDGHAQRDYDRGRAAGVSQHPQIRNAQPGSDTVGY